MMINKKKSHHYITIRKTTTKIFLKTVFMSKHLVFKQSVTGSVLIMANCFVQLYKFPSSSINQQFLKLKSCLITLFSSNLKGQMKL